MKIIKEKPWHYVLFDDGQGWILTFLIGGVIETEVSVRLTSDEIGKIKGDEKNILSIVENIQHNRQANMVREIIPPVWPPTPTINSSSE